MKTFFIGIDISKNTLDVAICEDVKSPISNVFKVENSVEGISKLINKCCILNKNSWFCFEHTGNYGYLLAHQLASQKLPFSVVPALEIKRSLGVTRGKSDIVDAKRIAEYAAVNNHKLKPFVIQDENIQKIKSLLAYRSQLVGISRQLKNSLKSHLVSLKTIDVRLIIEDIKENIDSLALKIKHVEQNIVGLINQNECLNKNYNKTLKVNGIGPIIAAYMLVCTNNFTAFENPRKFNCYAGLAPFEHTSGTSIKGKTKTSKLRNKTIKLLLFNGANSAAIFDPELKAYYKRKKEEGKTHMLIINNIACKLVYRIFAVVKREEPFVTLVR